MIHHDLFPYMGLPENYKLGYKVTKYVKFQHYSCIVTKLLICARPVRVILGKEYYHYKWTEPESVNYPLLCFKYITQS